jgi:Fe-S-cluster containining protein
MKSIDPKNIDQLPGQRLTGADTFNFRCHAGLACFNQCCRNLNLFLYPYDIIRLKNHMGITAGQFLDRHTNLVLRPETHFPDVLLQMADNPEKTCPFLGAGGCTVYQDRPDACRTFPVEQGVMFHGPGKQTELVHFFRPPDFCMGQHEDRPLSITSWVADQEADTHHRLTLLWSELKALFQDDPWRGEGPEGQRGKMAFMATYNMDEFRNFVFNSSFLKRFKIKKDLLARARKDDVVLMKLGFSWVKLYLWGMPTKTIRPKK